MSRTGVAREEDGREMAGRRGAGGPEAEASGSTRFGTNIRFTVGPPKLDLGLAPWNSQSRLFPGVVRPAEARGLLEEALSEEAAAGAGRAPPRRTPKARPRSDAVRVWGAHSVDPGRLRAAVDTIAAREKKLPLKGLNQFLANKANNPRARRLAFELIQGTAPDAAEKLIPTMLNDPSVELRRDAVQRQRPSHL